MQETGTGQPGGVTASKPTHWAVVWSLCSAVREGLPGEVALNQPGQGKRGSEGGN